MNHHITNAEIARLSHVETLRRTRHAQELRQDAEIRDVYTLQERLVSRLAARLAPELSVTLPWPTASARRAGGAQA